MGMNQHKSFGDKAREVIFSKGLSREEEIRLCDAWRQDGDIEARNRVVMAYVPLAMGLISRQRGAENFTKRQDLYQEAILGLIKAMDKFEPDRGFRFSTYARWWVMDSIRASAGFHESIVNIPGSSVVREMKSNMRRAMEAEKKSADRAGEYVTQAEIRGRAADRLNVPRDKAESMFSWIMYSDYSLNAKVSTLDGDEEMIDMMPDDSFRPDIAFEKSRNKEDMKTILESIMSSLKDREREVITRRHLAEDKETLDEIGMDFGLSRERIRQIEEKGFEKIRKFLKNRKSVMKDVSDICNF